MRHMPPGKTILDSSSKFQRKTATDYKFTNRNVAHPFRSSHHMHQTVFNDQNYSKLAAQSRFRTGGDILEYDIKGNTFKETLVPR